jgi:8-amino-7-oxononanoate synthase
MLACAVLRSLDIILEEPWRRTHLQRLVARLRDGLARSRWRLAASQAAIQPLLIGDNAEALSVADQLAERALLVPAIRPPTVPRGTARLRISLSAAHGEDDVERLVDALDEISGRRA